jgi:hypothetical protein
MTQGATRVKNVLSGLSTRIIIEAEGGGGGRKLIRLK